jgi:hypothetical protein
MRISGLLLAAICLAWPLASFADEDVEKVSYRTMINRNAANVVKINKGMTKDEVVQSMGNLQSKVRSGPITNPWKIELHGDLEIFHYITAGHPPFMPIMANQATPIVFRDGVVMGMGRGMLEDIKAAGPTRPSNPPEPNIEERLNTLKKLYDDGIIDEESYETQKQRILESI